jgi:hypothetical protein
VIGFWLGIAYRLPSTMDEPVFARIIVNQAGFNVAEADLTHNATKVICGFCQHLDGETPSDDRSPRSGSSILERCVELAVPHDQAVAYRVLAGLRPDLQAEGALKRYRPAARAALARDLRRVGRPIDQFARQGRFTETRQIDSKGVRPSRTRRRRLVVRRVAATVGFPRNRGGLLMAVGASHWPAPCRRRWL